MALPADQRPQPQLSIPGQAEQPDGNQAGQPDGNQAGQPDGRPPGLPPLSFPEQSAGQGPAPVPGGYSPQPPGGQAPGQQPEQPSRGHWPSGRGQGKAQRPPPSPRPPRPSRRPEREVRQRAFAALIFGMLSLLALLGVGYNIHRGIYLIIFTVVIGPVACWLAITATRRAHRDGTWRPRGAIAGLIFGVLGTVLGLGMLALFTLAAKQVSQYSQCLGQAQTLSAQHACTAQFERSLEAGLGRTGAGSAG
jgi:hypothetical protein